MDLVWASLSRNTRKSSVVIDNTYQPKTLKTMCREVINSNINTSEVIEAHLSETVVGEVFQNRVQDFAMSFNLDNSVLYRNIFGPITDCWGEEALSRFWGFRTDGGMIESILRAILPAAEQFCIIDKFYHTTYGRCGAQIGRKKTFVALPETTANICNQLILKASEKLEIDGILLVVEKDGTPISEDEVLLLLPGETFLLLTNKDKWISPLEYSALSSTLSNPETWISPSDHSVPCSSSSGSFDVPVAKMIVSAIADNEAQVISTPISAQLHSIINVDCNYETLWIDYEIPWNKVPSFIMEACEKGEVGDAMVTEIIHIIINSMKEIKANIPAKALHIVANKLVDKYPDVFKDKDHDNVTIGDGRYSIFKKLQDRNFYLPRPNKRKNDNIHQTILKNSKKQLNAKAGCPNWQPPIKHDDCWTQDMKQDLNSYINKELNQEFYKLLEKAFQHQRLYINAQKPPSLEDILAEWPILFLKETIKWHFNFLTKSNFDKLRLDLESKSATILDFMCKKKKVDQSKNNYSLHLNALITFAIYFKEDFSVFIFDFEGSDTRTLKKKSR
ncbi:unnamed protein product [Brassicogethes aeneus]|uniref:CIDE-N domain-containing protein n=1 Tax=Brassicogethes aeneus TaxID=1431903 RepID=A0A9P0BEE4_BRAAE|nr:unnamed protein product [Brassicogethes aeneus]